MLRLAFYLVSGYAVAAGFSDAISFDLSQTDWLSFWTYVVIGFGMIVSWIAVFLFFTFVLTALAAFGGKSK
jgi:hypothetical protein